MAQAKANVFIVAENRLLREAMTRLFAKRTDLRVVGAAQACSDALQEVAATAPEVILLGAGANALFDITGWQEVKQLAPQLKLVLFGMEDSEELFLTAVRSGAVGYVLKDASACDVVVAVRAAMQGEAVCPPRLCRFLFRHVAAQPGNRACHRPPPSLGLTRRERELIPMIAEGLTNKEIASRLNLSEQTVKNHIHRMIHKTGADSRLAVVERCWDNRLAGPEKDCIPVKVGGITARA